MSDKALTAITRRTGLGLMMAGLVGSTHAHAADALEQTTVDFGGVRDPQLGVQLLIASNLGLFKQEGLTVNVHWTESGSDILSLFAGNAYPLATSGVTSALVLAGRGIPVKIPCALSNYSGTQGIVLAPGVKLSSPKDLVGKRLASPASSPHIMMLAKLGKQYGFDSSQVKLVIMEPSEGVVATSKGDVDGALTYEPFMSRLVSLGGTIYVTGTTSYVTGQKQVLPPDDLLLYQHAMIIASDDWLSKNPNTMKAVLRAFLRANDVINNDRATASKMVRDFLHIDEATTTAIMSANFYGLALDQQVVQSIQFTDDWLQIVKRIPAPVAPASVLAPKLLAEIDPKLVSFKV